MIDVHVLKFSWYGAGKTVHMCMLKISGSGAGKISA